MGYLKIMKQVKKTRLFSIVLIVIIIFLQGCSNLNNQTQTHEKPKIANNAKRIKLNTTPTLFFHGALSSYRSEEDIVNEVARQKVSNSIIRANVNPDGKVTLIGKLNEDSYNPIVKVNYENNVQLNYKKAGLYATNVVKALMKKYDFHDINMVGHSLGNISIMYYLLENANNTAMPKLSKQISIAGYFDGIDLEYVPKELKQPSDLRLNENGKPNHMNKTYKEMAKLREIYPKNQVSVLNIVGDVGDDTDGFISNDSSLSLKYLAQNYAKSYQVQTYYGQGAEHGRLTYNYQVKNKVIEFLWGI